MLDNNNILYEHPSQALTVLFLLFIKYIYPQSGFREVEVFVHIRGSTALFSECVKNRLV